MNERKKGDLRFGIVSAGEEQKGESSYHYRTAMAPPKIPRHVKGLHLGRRKLPFEGLIQAEWSETQAVCRFVSALKKSGWVLIVFGHVGA